jgi:hypothetical protein
MTPAKWKCIDESITNNFIIPKEKCSPDFLKKIIDGAKASAAKPNGAFPSAFLKYLD